MSIPLLLEGTNSYLHQDPASRDRPSTSAMQDVKMEEFHHFLALTIWKGCDQRDSIRDYWSRDEKQTTPFPPQTIVHDHSLHILKYLHFAVNENLLNKHSPNCDRLWKLRKVSDILNLKFPEVYWPAEHINM
jgi:hypothetical protein